MDHYKFSALREKWRRYFEEGQREVFDKRSSEESDVKHPTLKENKAYVKLIKMSATNVSKDFNIIPPDIALSPLSDEIVHTAAEHKLEQHSDFPKLQLDEMDSDDTTVKGAQQYEHNTYAHELEPMLEQFDSKLAINADKSQLQEHQVESEEVNASDEFAQKHEEPVLKQFDSNVETRPQIPQVRANHPRVNYSQAICLGDLLRPEFAEQQERKLAQLQESTSDQQLELPMIMTGQPDLLKTNRKVYTLEDWAVPITPMVENYHRSKFARKVERKFRETQMVVRNKINSQPDLLQLQNNCEKPKKLTFKDILSQWKPYLIQRFMCRNAQYKMSLQPILEGEESETIQELVQPELEQQLHRVVQKSDLESYEEEPNMEQETESDDSHNKDYENSQSMDKEQSMVETSSCFSTAGAQNKWRNKNLHIIVLICITISLKTVEGHILEDLLNYATKDDIIVFMLIFFTLLCFCKIFDLMVYDEDETVDRVNDLTDNGPPVEVVDVQPSTIVALIRVLDQMRGGPQPDRNIQPEIAAPDDSQPMPPEQDMERE